MFYVYILYSQKLDKYYVGSTSNIERRMKDHNRGKTPFAKTGMPWVLKVSVIFPTRKAAFQREMYIKNQKSKKLIEHKIHSAGSGHPDAIGRDGGSIRF